MKYALILAGSESDTANWKCYGFANSIKELKSLACYDPNSTLLSKNKYPANVVSDAFDLKSCALGNLTMFVIIQFTTPIQTYKSHNYKFS